MWTSDNIPPHLIYEWAPLTAQDIADVLNDEEKVTDEQAQRIDVSDRRDSCGDRAVETVEADNVEHHCPEVSNERVFVNRRTAIRAAIGCVTALLVRNVQRSIRFERSIITTVDSVSLSACVKSGWLDMKWTTWEPFDTLVLLPGGRKIRPVRCTGYCYRGKHHSLPEHELRRNTYEANERLFAKSGLPEEKCRKLRAQFV